MGMVNAINYRDVIKMTITRAKGEGNDHFLSHRGNGFTISYDPIR